MQSSGSFRQRSQYLEATGDEGQSRWSVVIGMIAEEISLYPPGGSRGDADHGVGGGSNPET